MKVPTFFWRKDENQVRLLKQEFIKELIFANTLNKNKNKSYSSTNINFLLNNRDTIKSIRHPQVYRKYKRENA